MSLLKIAVSSSVPLFAFCDVAEPAGPVRCTGQSFVVVSSYTCSCIYDIDDTEAARGYG